jgi:hypothetical protein
MQETAEDYAPFKETKIDPKKKFVPWYTEELNNLITMKNNLISDYYYGLQCFETRIETINNCISHLKRKLKKYGTEKLIGSQGDTKKSWNILNIIRKRNAPRDNIEPPLTKSQQIQQVLRFSCRRNTKEVRNPCSQSKLYRITWVQFQARNRKHCTKVNKTE